MARETRISLLFGLAMIIAFGVVLSEVKRDLSPSVVQAAAKDRITAYSLTPADADVLEIRRPPGRRERRRNPRRPRPGPTRLAAREQAPRRQAPPSPAPVRPTIRRTSRRHTVQVNDTLTAIARRYYGPKNARHYKRIYLANRNILPNAKTVRPGQVLVIPPLGSGRPAAPAGSRRLGESVAVDHLRSQ